MPGQKKMCPLVNPIISATARKPGPADVGGPGCFSRCRSCIDGKRRLAGADIYIAPAIRVKHKIEIFRRRADTRTVGDDRAEKPLQAARQPGLQVSLYHALRQTDAAQGRTRRRWRMSYSRYCQSLTPVAARGEPRRIDAAAARPTSPAGIKPGGTKGPGPRRPPRARRTLSAAREFTPGAALPCART